MRAADLIFAGIDPGLTGAVALIGPQDQVMVYDFEDDRALCALQIFGADIRAAVEKVGAMPKQGVSSTFKFGANFGTWIGRLEALEIVFEYVTPAKWQKAVFDSAPAKGLDTKARSLDRARRLFPRARPYLTRKKDHNRADALLLAEYCRRFHRRFAP